MALFPNGPAMPDKDDRHGRTDLKLKRGPLATRVRRHDKASIWASPWPHGAGSVELRLQIWDFREHTSR